MDPVTGKDRTNDPAGVWTDGEMRTYNSTLKLYREWRKKTRLKSKKAAKLLCPKYMSVQDYPILLAPGLEDKWFLEYLPPDPLHICLLGPVNDVVDFLLGKHEWEMKNHMIATNLFKSRGGQPGGQLNGPQLKRLLQDKSLDALAPQVPHGQEIVRYLRSLREL